MQRKIIRNYYIITALDSMIGPALISAIYTTFLMKNGLSLFEVNAVNSVYFFTLFICEIPTGAFADIFGRKTAFITACLFYSLGEFVYGSSHTFFWFVVAEICGAVGSTFQNGAFSSWLVDSLKHHGYTGSFTRIFARENLIDQICSGCGAIGGAYLATISPSLPWFIGGIGMICLAILASVIMKEDYFVKKSLSWRLGLLSMRNVAVSSMRYATEHKAVRFILGITFIQIFCMMGVNMFWQPFFKGLGVAEKHYGFVFAAMMVGLMIGASIISMVRSEGREKKILLITHFFVGTVIIISVSVTHCWIAGAFFIAHEIGRAFWRPLLDGYLHSRIPSNERATITSFCSIFPHIGGAIGLLSSGFIADRYGIPTAWVVSGAVLILGALLVARNGKGS